MGTDEDHLAAVHRTIRALAGSRKVPTEDQARLIRSVLSNAPFRRMRVDVDEADRGRQHLGQTLGEREDSLDYHLFKRVVLNGQWAIATTADEYLADLRRATTAEGSWLVLYEWRSASFAAVLAETEHVVPEERRGPRWGPLLYVVYSVSQGAILTGFQSSGRERLNIPSGAIWHR